MPALNGQNKTYIAIDLKSFYASVECIERGLDPLKTNLVVADESRTQKTVCLAVSPALKSYHIGGRARLFEVVQRVKEINRERQRRINCPFSGKSCDDTLLKSNPALEFDYVIAPPRMALYMKYSTEIYQVYLKYVAPEDMHIYSIDEVFIDATNYIKLYKLSPHDFALKLIKDVLKTTGITATAGIGSNLYLCKVAMDIEAKHIPADKDGVRIAELTERSYREKLWNHTPITDFWRVGVGYAKKLKELGIFTMGDVARCSIGTGKTYNEDLLYKTFGVNAELLIDHAWGYEPCGIADIKGYKPESTSIGIGQVLSCAYPYEKGLLVVKEMAEQLSLNLVDKGLVCDQIVLTVGYDIENTSYQGEREVDRYGRSVPKQAHGSYNLGRFTASTKLIMHATEKLFENIIDEKLSVRRMYIVANHTVSVDEAVKNGATQLDLFTDTHELERESALLERERKGQEAVLAIKRKYGKDAILKGMNMEEGATAKERNAQIGGHKA